MFDVSYNTVANIISMFPEVHGDLAIREPTILTPEQELAQEQAAAGKKGAAKK